MKALNFIETVHELFDNLYNVVNNIFFLIQFLQLSIEATVQYKFTLRQ